MARADGGTATEGGDRVRETNTKLRTASFLIVGAILACTVLVPGPCAAGARDAGHAERAVEGGGERVALDLKTPLPQLIARLEGPWEEVETGKAYWLGYTDDMFSIAAHGKAAVAPLIAFIAHTRSRHARRGAVMALHLIGIKSRVAGRTFERFRCKPARTALLGLLARDDLREQVMSLLIRDPWRSDVPVLMDLLETTDSEVWPVVNGLLRYGLRDVPFRQPIPEPLATKAVACGEPVSVRIGEEPSARPVLMALSRAGGSDVEVEDSLFTSPLRLNTLVECGTASTQYASIAFGRLLRELTDVDHADIGSGFQYFVEGHRVFVCSAGTARTRWLDWWARQPKAYRRALARADSAMLGAGFTR